MQYICAQQACMSMVCWRTLPHSIDMQAWWAQLYLTRLQGKQGALAMDTWSSHLVLASPDNISADVIRIFLSFL